VAVARFHFDVREGSRRSSPLGLLAFLGSALLGAALAVGGAFLAFDDLALALFAAPAGSHAVVVGFLLVEAWQLR
jgi:hypothetical protein